MLDRPAAWLGHTGPAALEEGPALPEAQRCSLLVNDFHSPQLASPRLGVLLNSRYWEREEMSGAVIPAKGVESGTCSEISQMAGLQKIDELTKACAHSLENARAFPEYEPWGRKLSEFLRETRDADRDTRATEEFQQKIWNENPVSSAGRGKIRVDRAIANSEFRRWLADRSLVPLPELPEAREQALDELFDELLEKVSHHTARAPHLMTYRVMAAFFPTDFTVLTDRGRLRRLHRAMFEGLVGKGPTCHIRILRRLDEAIGRSSEDLTALADRMRLPWLLFKDYVEPSESEKEKTESTKTVPGEERLLPFPAARRRRGLTGVSGDFEAVRNILDFCGEGVPREDLKSYVRTISPGLKDASINTQLNVIAGELNCLKGDGDRYVLTDRGHAFLESGDPEDLMDWLVTRILGVDHALVILRDEGSCPKKDLISRIQRVNPGWTTMWAPTLIVTELSKFGMLDLDELGNVALTATGRHWAERVHWKPDVLVSKTPSPGPRPVGEPPEPEEVLVEFPAFSQVCDEVSRHGHFSESLIRKLDAGIWANKRRHFAVFTGLSGSGKTLLARAYGRAIAGTADGHGNQLCTIPVQPGWYDPTVLLGYVNPLQGNSYMRTPFLEFLLAAADAPARPFTVVLDEMNLSRPEQYLAPILSAMETGTALSLHREGEIFDGVPAQVPYPSNLVIIGTVNMDETTHGLSDKVLDRAFTIEFWDVDLAQYPRWGKRKLDSEHEGMARKLLEDLMEGLKPARLHFGWRVVDDVLEYMERVMAQGNPADPKTTLDSVVYAKILPKLRGDDSPRFREALDKCAQVLKGHGLRDCQTKVRELKDDLESTGSARFWR